MYESIIVRGLLLAIGLVGVWVGRPDAAARRMDASHQTVLGIIFMCGMFAIIGAIFAK
jgi:hypothetical protein